MLGWFNSIFGMENLHSYDKILEYRHNGDAFLLFLFQNLGIRRMLFHKYWKDNYTEPVSMQDLNSAIQCTSASSKGWTREWKKKRHLLVFQRKVNGIMWLSMGNVFILNPVF